MNEDEKDGEGSSWAWSLFWLALALAFVCYYLSEPANLETFIYSIF